MPLSSIAGPDFICIGMPKSGTGWLSDQLKYHPDFWMPPAKELAYLSRDVPHMKSVQKRLEKVQAPGESKRFKNWSNRRDNDSRDLQFLQELQGSIGRNMDLSFYSSMFRFKENALSGDISSGYCALKPEVLTRLSEYLPDTRIVLLVRDPVSRAWSHLCMWHRAGTLDEGLLDDSDEFRKFLDRAGKFQRTAFPSRIVHAWQEHAPRIPFKYFFFDDIADQPAAARRAILDFIGGDPEKSSGTLDAGYNKKSTNKKLPFTERIKDTLVGYFAEELKTIATMLGGHAASWPARYGL